MFMKENSIRIELKPRTRENVSVYFERVQDSEIKKYLPQKAKTVEEAIADFEKSLRPDSTSYGKSVYANGAYVGDVWAYCIGDEEQNAMLSYCIFEKTLWGKGVATEAVRLFMAEIKEKYVLKTLGAFTFSDNFASIHVLRKNGFQEKETFVEDGVESKYFQRDFL